MNELPADLLETALLAARDLVQSTPSPGPAPGTEVKVAAWIGQFYLRLHNQLRQHDSPLTAARHVVEELRLLLEAEGAVIFRGNECL